MPSLSSPQPPTTVGAKIRNARVKAGLSQLQLVRRMGLEGKSVNSFISRMEMGHTDPRLDTLVRIAKALECKVKDLMP